MCPSGCGNGEPDGVCGLLVGKAMLKVGLKSPRLKDEPPLGLKCW